MADEERVEADYLHRRRRNTGEDAAVKLHKASNATTLKKLLFEIKDHNALDSNGDAPLHCYVKRKDKEKFNCLITFLIHSKCDVNLLNIDGQTALHLACKINDMQVAKALIAFDAKINTVNIDDQTPLDLVPRHSDLEELLVLLGAMRCQEKHSSRVEGDGGINMGFLDEDDYFVISRHLEQTGSTSQTDAEKPTHYKCHGLEVCTGSSLSPTECAPSGLSSLPEEREEQVYGDKSVAENDSEPGKEKEMGLVDESSNEISLGTAGTTIDEADGADSHTEQPQRQRDRPRACASPDHFPQGQHGHSVRQKRREIGVRRQNIFRRQNSVTARKSLSEHNPDMEVMDSVIGQSVVRAHTVQQRDDQKILCLDGGGIKGLIQIEMLKMIEEMTGKSISELFDWVVGTSTGGILVLGMIYGEQSLDTLRRVYFGMKDTVLKRQSKFISHVCDTTALEDLIKGIVGTEKRMSHVSRPRVLITTVDKSTTALPLVFFNNCFDDKNFNNELVWKVARYTSAAPVFFAECDNYVDGGVKANNPTAFALTEIQNFLSHGSSAANISCVVSLGCGIYPPEPLGNTDIADALKLPKLSKIPDRMKQLLTFLTAAIGSSDEISRHCHTICEQQGIAYFRFNPKIGEEVGMTEKDSRKLCEIIIKAKQLFRENAEQVEKMIEQLGCKIKEDYLYHI